MLKDVAMKVTDTLDKNEGGFWLCSIRPLEIEGGLIKSEYKGLTMSFKRTELVYEVQVCQTNHYIDRVAVTPTNDK